MKNKIKTLYLPGILLVCFLVLTILVKMNATVVFDDKVYGLIAGHQTDGLTQIYKGITFFGSTLFMVLFCGSLFVFFLLKKKKRIAYGVASCLIGSTILNNVVKIIVRRARPAVIHLVTETSFSFPSGHTMAAVSMYGILIYFILKSNLNKSVKIILSSLLGILMLLVGISRIYLGAHFATDIIGAILLSSVWLLFFTNFIIGFINDKVKE